MHRPRSPRRATSARALSADPALAAAVMDALIESTVSAGRTLVVVTHDDDVAARCARLVRVRDGRILSDVRQGPEGVR